MMGTEDKNWTGIPGRNSKSNSFQNARNSQITNAEKGAQRVSYSPLNEHLFLETVHGGEDENSVQTLILSSELKLNP